MGDTRNLNLATTKDDSMETRHRIFYVHEDNGKRYFCNFLADKDGELRGASWSNEGDKSVASWTDYPEHIIELIKEIWRQDLTGYVSTKGIPSNVRQLMPPSVMPRAFPKLYVHTEEIRRVV